MLLGLSAAARVSDVASQHTLTHTQAPPPLSPSPAPPPPSPPDIFCPVWGGGPNSQKQLECGVAVFLPPHSRVGDTLISHLHATSSLAGFELFDIGAEPGTTAAVDLFTSGHWHRFLDAAYSGASPRAVLVLRSGPGISDELLPKVLRPMRAMLHYKGCELRLTTALHHPDSGIPSTLSTSDSRAGDAEDCASRCSYAGGHANAQIKHLLSGASWPSHYYWDPTLTTARCAAPLKRAGVSDVADAAYAIGREPSAFGNATYDLNVLLPRAREALSHFDFVGRAEDLASFRSTFDAMLGYSNRTASRLAADERGTPASWAVDRSRHECFANASRADAALYSGYCR